jgi:glycosyltransferase involved in cell wall biosynthesis
MNPSPSSAPAHAPAPARGGDDIELTIIMPCLNESLTLEACIREAQQFLAASGVKGEVLIGDNGSTDGSQDIARRCGARVVDISARGYGAALYGATMAARGRYIIMGDSDDSYDFTDLMPFVVKLREGYDLVMGNRFAGGIAPGAMPWKNRLIGNPLLSGLGRLLFRCPAKDFHCGIRGYSAAAFARMDLRTTGMEFASEMVIKASLSGMKIAEVPTTLSPDGRDRPPHLRPWRDGWRHLRFMLLYSPRWLFLYPGLVLMLLGLLAGGMLMPGPVTLGGVTFDVHTLLYAAVAVLVGFQAVSFAVFGKIFAMTEGLLPPDAGFERLFKYFRLETGLIAGFGLMLVGLAGSVWSLANWGAHSFGPLVASKMLRLVIPSGTCLALGCQVVMSSFLLSLMGMRRKSH